jgi:hypothetical protein
MAILVSFGKRPSRRGYPFAGTPRRLASPLQHAPPLKSRRPAPRTLAGGSIVQRAFTLP